MKQYLLFCVLSFCICMESLSQESDSELIEVVGLVYALNERNSEPLVGANIVAYTSDSTYINSSISDEIGKYSMFVNKIPTIIKISFVGYSTYLHTDIYVDNNRQINLNTCYLEADNTFSDIIVTASNVRHNLNKESYIITDIMRSKASNTLDILDQIHGLRYDKFSNDVKVFGKSNVLFLVNNLEQSKAYILNLAPERISKVEVNKSPSGKYQSEGYDAVINIVLKEKYIGYDITVQNFAISNVAGNNGNGWLMNEQPSVNLIYTNKKINTYANYTYGRSEWNTGTEKDILYKDLLDISSDKVNKDNPNDIYKYQGNAVSAGINYNINKNHILSFQGDYLFSKFYTDNLFNYNVNDLIDNSQYRINSQVINQTRSNEYTGTFYYRGKLSDKLSLYSDLSYSYFDNNVFNALSQDNDALVSNSYDEKKNVFKLNTEAKYTFSEKASLNLGYINNIRRYKSEFDIEQDFLDYKEYRHRVFSHLQLHLNEKLSLEAGSGLEYISMNNSDTKKHYWKALPYLIANYNINQSINLKGSYLTNMKYPSIHQLNSAGTAVDSWMTQLGNPNLRSYVSHSFSIDLSLWDRLTFTPSMNYSPDNIGEFITKDNSRFLTTFQNINTKEYSLQLVYDQPIGKYFSISNSITYYHRKAKFSGIRNSLNGWMLNSEVNYYNPTLSLMAQLGYYRSMDKNIRIQGVQMYNFDSWALTLSKQFFNNKVSVLFGYFLPLKWGVKDVQKRIVNTPDYNENYRINLRNYRNTFILRISYRFNSGKVKFSRSKNSTEREERINRTFDF